MTTKIEWTNETWNPVTGCTKISTGCRNCYAERMAKRLAGRYGYLPWPYEFDVTFHKEKESQPFRWKKPRMVFVCSMGDLFHEGIPGAYITNLFEIMAINKQHTFQVLTKRPRRMLDVLYGEEGFWYLGGGDFIPNVWLGVTAENQETADERIPLLLQATGFTKFASVEPMLEGVMLDGYLFQELAPQTLDWVICGGETGHGARPMKAEWAIDLHRQCKDAGVPFFFKKPGDAFEGDVSSLPTAREYPK